MGRGKSVVVYMFMACCRLVLWRIEYFRKARSESRSQFGGITCGQASKLL